VIAVTGQVQQQLARLFAQWVQAGGIPADRGTPEQLAWELFAPSAFVRLLYLHTDAAPATRRAGHQLFRRHLEFFITTVFATPTPPPTRLSLARGDPRYPKGSAMNEHCQQPAPRGQPWPPARLVPVATDLDDPRRHVVAIDRPMSVAAEGRP
jgi:hypothetical protein